MRNLENSCSKMLAYRPPRIAMMLLGIAALLQYAVPIDWPMLQAFATTGAVIAATGFGVMIRAWWLFRRHETAICPTAVTTTLITGDIYALTRNPMYLGMVLILLGVATLAGSWLVYAVVVFYALILNHVFCPYEEQKLKDQFGDRYTAYAARTRRWL
jgi:protein-S-isoprenylcysteine O-methyltransferase Ste14